MSVTAFSTILMCYITNLYTNIVAKVVSNIKIIRYVDMIRDTGPIQDVYGCNKFIFWQINGCCKGCKIGKTHVDVEAVTQTIT